jgi:hypothetical protein
MHVEGRLDRIEREMGLRRKRRPFALVVGRKDDPPDGAEIDRHIDAEIERDPATGFILIL